MTPPTTCFSYTEDRLNPGSGTGYCLEVHELKKGEQFPQCRQCADVIREGNCPRRYKTPYLDRK